MSLDVYLIREGVQKLEPGPHIFIRENGQIKEIDRDEWDARFPGREPVVAYFESDDETVFQANITHNLGAMAEAAGIYTHIWRPEEIGVEKANQIIEPLEAGLKLLKSDPQRFKGYDSENGWGVYDDFVPWVEKYLGACRQYPDAEVFASR